MEVGKLFWRAYYSANKVLPLKERGEEIYPVQTVAIYKLLSARDAELGCRERLGVFLTNLSSAQTRLPTRR